MTSCFLLYTGRFVPGEPTIWPYDEVKMPVGRDSDLIVLLFLFGGVAPVVIVAVVALVPGRAFVLLLAGVGSGFLTSPTP